MQKFKAFRDSQITVNLFFLLALAGICALGVVAIVYAVNNKKALGPTGPQGPTGAPGANSLDLPLSYHIFVDGNTSTPAALQNGAVGSPYATITQAINSIPACDGTALGCLTAYTVAIAPGTYEEDLVINGTYRRITLSALGGSVNLGTFNGTDGLVGTPTRSITWTATADQGPGNLRNTFAIYSRNSPGAVITTYEAQAHGFRVSGNVTITNSASSAEIAFNGVEVFGYVTMTGTTQIYTYFSRFRSQFNTGLTASNWQQSIDSKFGGLVLVAAYSSIITSEIAAGMNVTNAATAGINPDGFISSKIAGTFTGPAGSLRLDTYTNYWVVNGPVTLAGGVTDANKVLYSSTA